jgi:hypothetical protein
MTVSQSSGRPSHSDSCGERHGVSNSICSVTLTTGRWSGLVGDGILRQRLIGERHRQRFAGKPDRDGFLGQAALGI